MGNIEHSDEPAPAERIDWTTTKGRMEGRRRLIAAEREVAALKAQQAGAVAALVRIANTSPFDERWTHWREQAQAVLAEMGVDPSTYRGQ